MSSTNAETPPAGRWSLAARLTVWYAGSAFLLILGATGFLSWALHANLEREDDQFLKEKVQQLRAQLREGPAGEAALRRQVTADPSRRYAHMAVRVLDAGGQVLAETPGLEEELPPAAFPDAVAAGAEPGRGVEVSLPSGRPYRLVAARATLGPSGGDERVLQVAFDRTYEEELLAAYRRNLLAVLAAALVACAAVGYRIARRGLAPVREITEAARRVGATTLHDRLAAGRYPAELSVLAATFNAMLDRLEGSFNRLAQFSADVAHELRTPVNNLRGEAEVALARPRAADEYREVLGSSLEECGRLARLIDTLLFLARAENAETEIARERVDVGEELEAVRAFYEAAASEAGVGLSAEAPAGLAAGADRTLFRRAVGNLVANALAHTPRGGRVALTAREEGGAVAVEVSDTGGGIAPEHLPHVFDRFYRADRARAAGSGRVGLGLAIVKSIAALHGGTAAVTSAVGQGTRVTLTIPTQVVSRAGGSD
jgi:two-component system heavy metal sensor histidine kinase CusS